MKHVQRRASKDISNLIFWLLVVKLTLLLVAYLCQDVAPPTLDHDDQLLVDYKVHRGKPISYNETFRVSLLKS